MILRFSYFLKTQCCFLFNCHTPVFFQQHHTSSTEINFYFLQCTQESQMFESHFIIRLVQIVLLVVYNKIKMNKWVFSYSWYFTRVWKLLFYISICKFFFMICIYLHFRTSWLNIINSNLSTSLLVVYLQIFLESWDIYWTIISYND